MRKNYSLQIVQGSRHLSISGPIPAFQLIVIGNCPGLDLIKANRPFARTTPDRAWFSSRNSGRARFPIFDRHDYSNLMECRTRNDAGNTHTKLMFSRPQNWFSHSSHQSIGESGEICFFSLSLFSIGGDDTTQPRKITFSGINLKLFSAEKNSSQSANSCSLCTRTQPTALIAAKNAWRR